MDLGILETGAPPADLKNRFGSYGDMFRQMLGPDYRYAYYDVRGGHLPEQADRHDAYLITGSASGVYDGDAWIEPLKQFIQQSSGRTPMVGICFGHQVMAEAYGGRVAKSPKGWGVGLHSYEIKRRADWMNSDAGLQLSIPVSHQDQIIELPVDAKVLAASEFTPYAVLEYPERRAISFQGHPEFSPEYATALIDLRRGTRYQQEFADAAASSLQKPNDAHRVAGWIRNFLGAHPPTQG
ncbi:GMP synthase [Steroidobacter agaridevorans]|uniref:GMP synthase n=1 Tax=Steroidobacter agaridevorans TaxID=2695856 RepID=A0A829YLR7_9GAMM|nr:homoserine O-succinyltransferase [Steroidobacter agaridevorans]GFE83831.1 GMP synthase [Steroidobacter agaridevorans]GFE91581.1 GMP synthase [Steroidobacter agaridevorans]